MKNIFLFVLVFCVCCIAKSQDTSSKPAILYGSITKDSLLQLPFKAWFQQGYDEYVPDSFVAAGLKKINTKGISISVFMGTWCGDSRREVPRFFKLLDAISFPMNRITMYGLGSSDSLYKQSPLHEEVGKGIFRVPTFIIYKNGEEISRINEFPVVSLEKDLNAMLNAVAYTPNYKSFSLIKKWLSDGTLKDKNSSIRGLADQLKNLVESEHELNSLGYVLLKQSMMQEAVSIFRVNANLYPESANVLSSLGEGYHSIGEDSKAVSVLERSLDFNKDPQLKQEILKLLYAAKGLK